MCITLPTFPFSQGWLAVLLATIKHTPVHGSLSATARPVGMVGPMFLGREYLVQEAGGWMYQDATGGNYYRNKHVRHEVWLASCMLVCELAKAAPNLPRILPQANYRREVDYVSAAAVLVDSHALEGGPIFDTVFEDGYYEDTDLAFRYVGCDGAICIVTSLLHIPIPTTG